AKDIENDIRCEYGINVWYLKANRAKGAALEAINGTDEDSYNALPKYCDDLGRNNPDSTIVLECTSEEENSRFRRMFVCYAASAIGFGYCPPVLGLVGTHLKTKYRGILTGLIRGSDSIIITLRFGDNLEWISKLPWKHWRSDDKPEPLKIESEVATMKFVREKRIFRYQ